MREQRPVAARAVGWVVAVVLVATGTLYVFNALDAEYPWINHDVGYHTYLGQEMARGLRLYVDLKEDNPPGSPLLLGALFVVADALGVPDFAAQHLFVLGLGVAGFGVLRFALGRRREPWLAALTALAYLLVVIRGGYGNSLFPDAPGLPYDFGQREHLFSLLFLPYVLARIHRRRSPWWLLTFCGLLGWIATFKPFWPPMLLIVEGFVFWRNSQRDWRVPAALAVGLVSPVLVLGLHSFDALARFLTENIPMYFRGGYDFYETKGAAFLSTGLHVRMLIGALACGAAGWFAIRAEPAARQAVSLFAALAGVVYFSVWYQAKFWSYHSMPFFALTVVPAAYLAGLALGFGEKRSVPRAAGVVLALGLTAWSALSVLATARMLGNYPPLGSFLCPAVERYERVMYFSMSVMVQYPPLRARKAMVGPWTVFLDLPELLAWPEPVERERRLSVYAAEVRATIERERPELLVFSPYAQALPRGTTMHGILQRIEALPVQGYRPVSARTLGATDPRAAEWLFYVRSDAPRGPAP